MITVPVDVVGRRYEVVVGAGVVEGLAGLIADRVPMARRAAIVTQRSLVDQPWFGGIDPGLPFDVHLVATGEVAKSLSTIEALCRGFAASGLGRGDVVVAIGGGVVTDVAGYAAASFHRGIAYANVATTLLAQVDAAVGGKTGVNLPEGKNLVGAFWQPIGVLCDTAVLATLSDREWACGRGEMAKYAFLGAPDVAELPIEDQVARCVEIKAEIVGDDEREGGRRMVLNYGHTLAHALEAAAFDGGDLRHGEAVGIGLVYAALLARALGRIDDDRVAAHRAVVSAFGLSDALPAGADPVQLISYMSRDKKADHDLTFVLDGPRGIEVLHGVEPDVVLATLAEMAKCS